MRLLVYSAATGVRAYVGTVWVADGKVVSDNPSMGWLLDPKYGYKVPLNIEGRMKGYRAADCPQPELWLRAVAASLRYPMSADLVEGKYNPYHGADGRFASGGLGGAAADRALSDRCENGFTIDIRTGFMPTTGYGVAIPGAELKIPSAGKVSKAKLTKTCTKYAADHSALLGVPGNHFGGWLDKSDGTLFLDVSRVFSSQAAATAFGKTSGQKAIFDLKNKVTIPIDKGASNMTERKADEQESEVVVVGLPNDDPEQAADILWELLHGKEE
jgi:hypothetical protein